MTSHSEFTIGGGAGLKRTHIQQAQEKNLLDPEFIVDLNPTKLSSIGSVTVADFNASAWNGDWLKGTGKGGDATSGPYDHFYLIDMVPMDGDQVLWIQKVEVEADIPYRFKVDLVNLGDPNGGSGSSGGLTRFDPDVAVRVYDGRPGVRELGRWQLPEATPTGANVTCGLEWDEKTVDDIYFEPITTIEDGIEKKYAFIAVMGYDASLIGCDMGMDNICLEEIPLDNSGDLTANDHCTREDLVATFSAAPYSAGTLRWYVDGVKMQDNTSTDISSSTLDIGLHSNINTFGAGKHTIKVTYNDGTDDQELYQVFEVTESAHVKAFMEYSIDESVPEILFSPRHAGSEVKFYRYNSITDFALADIDNDGVEDGTAVGIARTQLTNTNLDGYYTESISKHTGTNDYYFCKYVKFGCNDDDLKWARDCGQICPVGTTAFELSWLSTTYNTSTEKYDVVFQLSDPTGMPQVHFYFNDETEATVLDTDPDGSFGSNWTYTHSYDSPGHYSVCVTGEWFEECVKTSCVDVDICENIVDAGFVDAAYCLGTTPIALDADPGDVDVAGTAYKWILDHALMEKPIAVAITETYTPSLEEFEMPGDYTLTLKKSAGCATASESATITIVDDLVFGFNWASEEVNGYLVHFSAGRTIQANEDYRWYIDFGSGYQLQSAQNDFDGEWTYDFTTNGAGEYNVKLVITNTNNSCSWTNEKLICVAATPMDCCNCAP